MIETFYPYGLGLAAATTLVCVIILTFKRNNVGAGILAAVFVACVFLSYIPKLASFKAFSVEVRLKDTLDRADEIVARLKSLTIVSAKASYRAIGFSLFLGTTHWEDVQNLLIQIDNEVEPLQLSEHDRKELIRPYTDILAYRLYTVTIGTMQSVADQAASRYDADLSAEEKNAIVSARARNSQDFNTHLMNFRADDWDRLIFDLVPSFLREKEKAKAIAYLRHIDELYKSCVKTRGLTDETASLIGRTIDQNFSAKEASDIVK